MILCVVFVAWVVLIHGQLEPNQYSALMQVYQDLGKNIRGVRTPLTCRTIAGCPTSICPRFNSSTPCMGSKIVCDGQNVVTLCEILQFWIFLHFFFFLF